MAPTVHGAIGLAGTSTSTSPALTGWPVGTSPVPGDLVLIAGAITSTSAATWSQTAGTGTWTFQSTGDSNTTAGGVQSFAAWRIFDGTETTPTFTTTAASAIHTVVMVAISPDSGFAISIDTWATALVDTVASTSHQANAATAAGSGEVSLLLSCFTASAVGTTAITEGQPSGWTSERGQSQVGLAGTFSNFTNISFQVPVSGTVTPAASTSNVSTVGNIYHVLVTQVPLPPVTVTVPPLAPGWRPGRGLPGLPGGPPFWVPPNAGSITAVPVLSPTAGLATGTGAAQQTAGHNAMLASGATAITYQNVYSGNYPGAPSTTAVTITAGLATAAGAAPAPVASLTGGFAAQPSAAAAAGLPTPAAGANAGLASAAGTIGSGYPPVYGPLYGGGDTVAVTVNAGVATGTGAAPRAAAALFIAGLASGTGTAQPALAVLFTAGLATATGAVPASTLANAQLASGATAIGYQNVYSGNYPGAPSTPGAGVNAGLASGTATAQAPVAATGVNAGLASGTGTAQPIGVGLTPGLATGAGAAQQTAGHNAQLASGTGTAQQPTVTTSGSANAPAVAATGTGAAQPPVIAITVNAGLASGTGTAQPIGVGLTPTLATAAGTAQPVGVGLTPGLASGTGAAQAPLVALTVTAGLATGAGVAQAPLAATGGRAGLASGTGTAQPIGVGLTPVLATAIAAAKAPTLAAAANAAAAQALAAALAPTAVAVAPFTIGALTASVAATATQAPTDKAASVLTASTAAASTIT